MHWYKLPTVFYWRDILRKCISIAECEIFLAGYFQNQEAVMKFSKNNVSDCEEILSTQEEADIRIILQL
jgi:hypothetical protein